MESEYFKKELSKGGTLTCQCGKCNAKLADNVIKALDVLRAEYGKPVYIAGGPTCKDYSVNVIGRSSGSQHIDNGDGATAVDIAHRTFNSKEDFIHFLSCAYNAGIMGLGISTSYFDIHATNTKRLHIDFRDTKDIISWMYYK
jgi:hypothetical protein